MKAWRNTPGEILPHRSVLPRLKEAVAAGLRWFCRPRPGPAKRRAPLALLAAIPPEKGRVLMLEPRRIAAVSAARWMAKTSRGDRADHGLFHPVRKPGLGEDRIEVVTRESSTGASRLIGPGRGGHGHFDEFHERSLQADLALAFALTSAGPSGKTSRFWSCRRPWTAAGGVLLDGAPVISSAGEAFPVEERYRPDEREKPLQERITAAVLTALRETSGDILVFLPGGGEIRACAKRCGPLWKARGRISIHPLYGDLRLKSRSGQSSLRQSEKLFWRRTSPKRA